MNSTVLIVGAKSDIAKEIARIYNLNGYDLYLAARNVDSLSRFSNMLLRNGKDIKLFELDIANMETHEQFYKNLPIKPSIVIIVSGYMPIDNKICLDEIANTVNVNYLGPANLLNIIAYDMEIKKSGSIVGISSVAGDRGRGANYIYGSSKAAFSVYLSGLRNRLFKHGVKVLTVKPGFVNTKMTKNKNLPKYLTNSPANVANDIFNAQQSNKDLLYTKKIWKIIMIIIKLIPEFIFKRMSL